MTGNPHEEERWGLWPWLLKQADKYGVRELIIAGDGTEAKDRHNAMVVHRMVDELNALTYAGVYTYWLIGNHDYLDPEYPFFKFLGGLLANFEFITKPKEVKLSIGKTILLPNTPDWKNDWKGIDFAKFDYAFAHQTFSGAVTETGYRLIDGLPADALDDVRIKAYSGDIHVPQKFGKRGEYLGAPYRTRHGDKYEGRVLLIENSKGKHKQTDLHYETKGKHLIEIRTLDDMDGLKIPKGGYVKVRVRVSRADLPNWQETKAKVKAEVERRGWEVHDVEMERIDVGLTRETAKLELKGSLASPRGTFDQYCKSKKTPKAVIDEGRDILTKLGAR
jgi:hypothetical protein